MEDILQITKVSKSYADFKLQDINLNLKKGTIMGFVGENGAGKTTTIKLILDMIKRDAGNIKVFGLDNIEKSESIKEQIGVVMDEGFFYEGINPKEINNVMKNIRKNWDEKQYFSYLKQFDLPTEKIIKGFSKGMRMKLAICTALSHHPKLLILDEPTSGLDPIVRSEMLDIFLEFIQDEEKAILFSTHITSDLDKIADYITFLHKGQIIFSKPKDEVIEEYGILKCGLQEYEKIEKENTISEHKNRFGYEVLIQNKTAMKKKYPNLIIDNTNIEEIMLFYVRRDQ